MQPGSPLFRQCYKCSSAWSRCWDDFDYLSTLSSSFRFTRCVAGAIRKDCLFGFHDQSWHLLQ